MKLPTPAKSYDIRQETMRNSFIEAADLLNRKKGQDLEIAGSERLILSSPDGTRWKITVSNAGAVSATAI